MHNGPLTQNEHEAGSGLVGLMIGISLSVIVMLGASQFFLQTKTKSRDMLGETEALAHSTMLVRRAFSANCTLLNLMKGATFNKGARGETVIASLDEPTLKQKGALEEIPMLKADGMKNYVIKRIDLIQKGDVIGRDPPHVLAEVEFTVGSSFNTSSQVIKPYKFRVPMMYQLEKNFTINSCMTRPNRGEMCKLRGGIFNDKSSICK